MTDSTSASTERSGLDLFGWSLMVLTLGAMVLVTIFAWPDHVYDRSPVRQTQTLLTIASFLKNGFTFSYETPIFAYPWRVPLEFPLYQALAAAFSRATTVRAAFAAQAITMLFHASSLALTWRSLGQLGVPPSSRAITISLIAASPLYLFWSQTVTIESTALFLSLAYFDSLISYARTRKTGWLALSMLVGSLAGAVKSTTFTVWVIVAIGALLIYLARDPRRVRENYGVVLPTVAAAFVVPILATVAWTQFADGVKTQNGTASAWASSNLHTFALGTIQQKLSLGTWKTLLVGRPLQLLGSPLALLPIPLALVRSRRWSAQIVLSLAGYLAPYALLTNLHFIHDYYSYENGILLIVAIGFSIDSLLSQTTQEAVFARLTVIPGTLVLMYAFFFVMYAPAYAYARGYPVADLELVRQSTSASDAVALVHGPSAELAYAADRRVAFATSEMLRAPEQMSAALGPTPLGAVGLCGDAAKDSALVDRVVTTYRLLSLALPVYPRCAIFVSARNAPLLDAAVRSIRERATVTVPPTPNGHADAVIMVSSGPLLTFWGAARYRCPVTKGQRVRVLLRTPTATLSFPVDRVNSDPGERSRFSMMRAYDRWYDGTVDTSVTLQLSPYVLGDERYQIGLEVSPPPACASAPTAVVWTDQTVTGALVPATPPEGE